ncbi:rifin PIR protein, putative [Plasmodium reichenowi]|uniref:Rifin PIR protein, putative n=1 Tax=Plasmodium reichenowi TaxID=5854 RepID=A0A2P9DSA7_PLARE|nr:rifin PIR protein, putative [Plasmodium reichenowi]
MKLQYFKILLCFILLNILAHNKNKPSITLHHIQTNRSLCECDIQLSSYDKDVEMKSVREGFDRQTSQRFQEYGERMKDKRQKRKEERDKNIQKIIEKDKMEKSLSEKLEKVCLRCGCGLGGGVLPVWGLVSGLWYATLSQNVTKLAIKKGIEKGIEEGIKQIGLIFQKSSCGALPEFTVADMLSSGKFTKGVNLYDMAKYISDTMYHKLQRDYYSFVQFVDGMAKEIPITSFNEIYGEHLAIVAKAFEEGKAAEFAAKTGLLSNTIIASIVTIIIIVLVMIIIYIVLRYRRKKKMNKKAQYTKLLNQ